MLYTVRLNATELASARCIEKMYMEDMQPNLAITRFHQSQDRLPEARYFNVHRLAVYLV